MDLGKIHRLSQALAKVIDEFPEATTFEERSYAVLSVEGTMISVLSLNHEPKIGNKMGQCEQLIMFAEDQFELVMNIAREATRRQV
jgi:hypothetical protein